MCCEYKIYTAHNIYVSVFGFNKNKIYKSTVSWQIRKEKMQVHESERKMFKKKMNMLAGKWENLFLQRKEERNTSTKAI